MRSLAVSISVIIVFFGSSCGDDDGGRPRDSGIVDGAPDGSVSGPPGCGTRRAAAPTVTTCPGDSLPAPSPGPCTVTPGSSGILITGDVLVPGEILRGGQVLVDGSGQISCVGCDCSTETGAADASQVVCPDSVVSPGLINAHDHITFIQNHPYDRTDERYEHRHDWRRGLGDHERIPSRGSANGREMAWGELRFVMGGATSINGSGSTDGFLRNLDRSANEGLDQPAVEYDTFPLGDTSGTKLDGSCDYPEIATAADIASEDAYTPHVSEGIDAQARNEFLCIREGATDLVQPQSAFIHGIGLRPSEISEMATNGTALIWSPRSNVTLYGDTARVTEYHSLGVPIALGTDWMPTGSMNVLRELTCADELNTTYLGDYFSDEELWLMATREAAAALAVDDVIGTIAVGMVADIAIFNASSRTDHRAVIEATASDVALVLRGGQVLYGDANVVSGLEGSPCDAIDVCGQAKQACVMRELGSSLAALGAENTESYPLFFCGVPDNEPSCVPERSAMSPFPLPVVNGSGSYTGIPSSTDTDGDGILDASDNCICTFNPVRPLDDGMQADFDGDGTGDACDPCPLTPGLEGCAPPDPSDRDGDGTPNVSDNCPDERNDQADGDMDGKGDVCDPCPEDPNPGTTACPASIYDVKDGTIAVGASVSMEGVVVTAVGPNGFFLQTPEAHALYTGPDFSGVFVYTGMTAEVSRGDVLEIGQATISNFFGQIQLTSVSWLVTASGSSLPSPVEVAPVDVAVGGGRAAALEGTLITVMDVTVTNASPPPGAGDGTPTNEFEVTSGLRVDDYIYLIEPLPTLGEELSITGALAFRNSFFKLLPRDAGDLSFGPPALSTLTPALSYARHGDTGSTFPTPLTVSLTRPSIGATMITLNSSGGGLSVSNVTIPDGATSTVVPVTANTPSFTAYTVTASMGGRSAMADVRVLGATEAPSLVALEPGSSTAVVDSEGVLTVTMDIPAPPGGATITLSADSGVSVPGSVTVMEDELSARFVFTAGSSASSSTVRAIYGGDTVTATIEVVEGSAGLIINEIDYDQPSTDTEEFIELYNGSGATVSLSNLDVVLINGSTSSEYGRTSLTGSLAPGQYLVIAPDSVVLPSGVARAALTPSTNAIQNGGPDGVLLVDTVMGTVLDALSYEGAITNATVSGISGPVNLVEGTALSSSVFDDPAGAGSLSRLPNGLDTDDSAADWAFTTASTPGMPNLP